MSNYYSCYNQIRYLWAQGSGALKFIPVLNLFASGSCFSGNICRWFWKTLWKLFFDFTFLPKKDIGMMPLVVNSVSQLWLCILVTWRIKQITLLPGPVYRFCDFINVGETPHIRNFYEQQGIWICWMATGLGCKIISFSSFHVFYCLSTLRFSLINMSFYF